MRISQVREASCVPRHATPNRLRIATPGGKRRRALGGGFDHLAARITDSNRGPTGEGARSRDGMPQPPEAVWQRFNELQFGAWDVSAHGVRVQWPTQVEPFPITSRLFAPLFRAKQSGRPD